MKEFLEWLELEEEKGNESVAIVKDMIIKFKWEQENEEE